MTAGAADGSGGGSDRQRQRPKAAAVASNVGGINVGRRHKWEYREMATVAEGGVTGVHEADV